MKSILSIVTVSEGHIRQASSPENAFFFQKRFVSIDRLKNSSIHTSSHSRLLGTTFWCHAIWQTEAKTKLIIELGFCASRQQKPPFQVNKSSVASLAVFLQQQELKCCAICTPSGCPRSDAHSQQVASSSNHWDQWFSTDSMIPWSKKKRTRIPALHPQTLNFLPFIILHQHVFRFFSGPFHPGCWHMSRCSLLGRCSQSISCPLKGQGTGCTVHLPAHWMRFKALIFPIKMGTDFTVTLETPPRTGCRTDLLVAFHHDIPTTSSKLEIHCLFQSDLSHELGRCLPKAYGLLIAENTRWHSTRNQFSSCCILKWSSKQNWCLANLNGPPFQQLRHHSIWPSRESNACSALQQLPVT